MSVCVCVCVMAANWLRFDWHRKLASIAVDGCAGNGWNVSPGHGSGFDGIHGRFKKSISMSHLIFLSVMFFSVKEPEPESARIPESTLPKNPPRILQESSKNPPISSNILQYPPISRGKGENPISVSSVLLGNRPESPQTWKNHKRIPAESKINPECIPIESQMNPKWISIESWLDPK